MDLAERLEALKEQNKRPLAPTTYEMSEDELKARYLDLLSEGYSSPGAAQRLGKTGSWFKRRRTEGTTHYDSSFEEMYEEIMRPDGAHRESLVASARDALLEAAKSGNVRAIEKILMAYDPDYAFLKPAQFSGDVNVDKMLVLMEGVPTPVLEQVRAAIREQRALPEGEQ